MLAEETEGCVGVPVGSGRDGGLLPPACPVLPPPSFSKSVMASWGGRKGEVGHSAPHPPQQAFSHHGTEAHILRLFASHRDPPFLIKMIVNAIQPWEWEGAERKWTVAKNSPPEAADPRLRSGRTEAPGLSVVATFWNSVWVACYMSAVKPPGAINEEKNI